MNSSPAQRQFVPPSGFAVDGGRFFERLDSIEKENSALGQELLRCYEQLNLVFEITEKIATLHEPHAIRDTLLQRFAGLMNAGAVGVWDQNSISVLEDFESQGRRITQNPASLFALLTDEIELVRSGERVRVAPVVLKSDTQDQEFHALLGALRDGGTKVIVVLRSSEDQPFDSSDMLAAESILGYGGHILNNIVISRQLQKTAMQTVRALAAAIDAKDNYTRGHSERVGWLGRFLGEAIRLPYSELQMLAWAGLLHDIGKIGVPEAILNKPGKLTDAEFEEIKKHPQIGHDV
ncbi:MAG: HD-GYP domain-containing protein, partial [Phycisphaerae bacterium]